MNRPVIFLDFDEVLNTEQYQAQLSIEGKLTKDTRGQLFDPRAAANLRRILDATNAAIVISSSWRYIHNLESLRMMWEVGSYRMILLILCRAVQHTSRAVKISNTGLKRTYQ